MEDLASDHTQQDDQQQTGSNAKGGEESDSHNASFTLDVQFARKLFTNQSSIEQLSDSRCFSCNSIGVRAVRQLWPYEFMATRFRANQRGKPFAASEHLTFPASADLLGTKRRRAAVCAVLPKYTSQRRAGCWN